MKHPGYIRLYETGELFRRIEALNSLMKRCTLCPRNCRVDRSNGETGVCKAGPLPMVSAAHPHFGEEKPLVGRSGSGTVFFTCCNLKCVFCQNHDISQGADGAEVSTDELASIMAGLQKQGCCNINFVTPTHQIAGIVEALPGAVELGLELPLVYNCGGYESVEVIRLLEGIFDIYMPDLKYGSNIMAIKYSSAPKYVENSRAAVLEMHRQVGDLVIDKNGAASKGLLIRHLVMPGDIAGTKSAMRFIANELSKNTYVNIMDQYMPCYRAMEYPELSRRVTADEFQEALNIAREAGLTRIDGDF